MDSGTMDRIHLSEGTQVPFLRIDISRHFITRLPSRNWLCNNIARHLGNIHFSYPSFVETLLPPRTDFSRDKFLKSNINETSFVCTLDR